MFTEGHKFIKCHPIWIKIDWLTTKRFDVRTVYFFTNTNLQAGLERKLQLTALDNDVWEIQQMDL